MMDEDQRKEILKRSVKQEQRTADTYRGSRNVMSGAGWVRKNDVRAEHFLIENKFTDKKSYSIKADEMLKLSRTALMEDRIPLLQVDLQGRRYVVLCEDDLMEILNGYSEE